MIKVGVKSSMDPVQQKLRQSKALWNKEVSTFVNDLIHYKKLMNGWPNKFFKERSKIGDPIPADPATIIGSLAADFQEIANKGNAVIQEQVNYAKTRRKKQPKQMELPLGKPDQTAPATPPAGPTPDLSQQLALPAVASAKDTLIKVASTFEDKYELEATASNPITRFFTKLFTSTIGFGSGPNLRRARMAMLSAGAKCFKDLEKFQVEIVKSSDKSVSSSYELMKGIWYEWMKIKLGFDTARDQLPKEIPEAGGPLNAPVSKTERDKIKPQTTESFEGPEEGGPPDRLDTPPPATPAGPDRSEMEILAIVRAIKADYAGALKRGRFGDDSALFSGLNNYLGQYQMTPELNIGQSVINEYKNIIAALNAKYTTNKSSLNEIAFEIEKAQNIPSPKVASAQLESLAQAFLKKWLGKLRHSVLTNKTSSLRLNAYDSAGRMRVTLDKIMDQLEDGLNIEAMAPLMAEMNAEMTKTRGTLRALHLSGKQDGKRIPLY